VGFNHFSRGFPRPTRERSSFCSSPGRGPGRGNEGLNRRLDHGSRSAIEDELDAGWRHLTASSAARDALARWNDETRLAGAGSLDELLATPRRGYETADSLIALTRRAASDAVAAQCVLLAMTPGLVRLAARTQPDPTRDDSDAELIALSWERIVTYPCDRRPCRVAANILADTRKRYRSLHRVDERIGLLERVDVETSPPCDYFIDTDDQPVHQLLLRGVQSAILRPHEAELIWETRICERPDDQAAADRRLSLRAMRQRRRRAESRLATLPEVA
jgi:hypothetical protein